MSLPVEQNPEMMSQNEKDLEKKKLDEVAEKVQDLLKRQVSHVVMHGWEKAFFVRFKTLTGKIKVGKIGLTITFDIIRTLIQNEGGIPPVQQRLNYKGRDVHNMDLPRSLGFCSDADAGEAELIHIMLRLGCDGGLRRKGCRGRCDDCFTRMPEVSRKNMMDFRFGDDANGSLTARGSKENSGTHSWDLEKQVEELKNLVRRMEQVASTPTATFVTMKQTLTDIESEPQRAKEYRRGNQRLKRKR